MGFQTLSVPTRVTSRNTRATSTVAKDYGALKEIEMNRCVIQVVALSVAAVMCVCVMIGLSQHGLAEAVGFLGLLPAVSAFVRALLGPGR